MCWFQNTKKVVLKKWAPMTGKKFPQKYIPVLKRWEHQCFKIYGTYIVIKTFKNGQQRLSRMLYFNIAKFLHCKLPIYGLTVLS